jgi:hypothetical protein
MHNTDDALVLRNGPVLAPVWVQEDEANDDEQRVHGAFSRPRRRGFRVRSGHAWDTADWACARVGSL